MERKSKLQIVCTEIDNCQIKDSTIHEILVPYDGSHYSEHAFAFALDLANHYGANITTLTIIYEIPSRELDISHQTSINAEKSKKMQKTLKLLKDSAKKFGVSIKNDVSVNSEILEPILSYISSYKIDLVVMGSRSRPGPDRYVIGSVAHGVCKNAHCPVLLVK